MRSARRFKFITWWNEKSCNRLFFRYLLYVHNQIAQSWIYAKHICDRIRNTNPDIVEARTMRPDCKRWYFIKQRGYRICIQIDNCMINSSHSPPRICRKPRNFKSDRIRSLVGQTLPFKFGNVYNFLLAVVNLLHIHEAHINILSFTRPWSILIMAH